MLQWNIFLMATDALSISRSGGASNWEHSGSLGLLHRPKTAKSSSILGEPRHGGERPASPHPCLPARPADDRRDTNGSLIAFLVQPWGCR